MSSLPPDAADAPAEITAREFRRRLKHLLAGPVADTPWDDKLALARECLRELADRPAFAHGATDHPPLVHVVPFAQGRQPIDEALSPGRGASECVGLLDSLAPSGEGDELFILFRLRNLHAQLAPGAAPFEVTLSAAFLPFRDAAIAAVDGAPVPVPGLDAVALRPQVVSTAAHPLLRLEDSAWGDHDDVTYATAVSTHRFAPHAGPTGWSWSDVGRSLRASAPDGDDPFTFCNFFAQRVRVEITVRAGGEVVARDATEVEVFDTGRFGSLYARVLDQLVRRDSAAQARALDRPELHEGHHPWYPVLVIGMDKAALYLRAIREDLQESRRNLPDSRWLLRVGLYLEYLTCLGVFEAVRDEYPDLLTVAEREAFEHGPRFEAVRNRLDVAAWKKVWALRAVKASGGPLPAAGPVSITNLRRKQHATLAFLHAHHEDLKQAIELAGPNLGSAQETWHRVFRDAERAVLRNAETAFPELAAIDPAWREFVLWHVAGDFGRASLTRSVSTLFGDEDALFPSASRQYRRSMNDVARHAAAHSLMDYTGDECVPRNASLIESRLANDHARYAALERRDGHAPAEAHAARGALSVDEVADLLRRSAVFRPLTDREVRRLAQGALRVSFAPLDRIVVQGEAGTSVFLLAQGAAEVLVRQGDGRDRVVATLEAGAIFGEVAVLTGAERSATVRAVDDVALFEIHREALRPIFETRPRVVAELAALIASRREDGAGAAPAASLASRIRSFVFG